MIPDMVRAIADGADILTLSTGLLRLCREHIADLHHVDCDPGIWRARESLRQRCLDFFREVDDEELDPEEQDELTEIAVEWSESLPPIAVVHTIAEALDQILGPRLLPMFMGREVVLEPGDPIPTPHPDWRRLTPEPNSDPWNLDGRLDAIAHLRLASDWARHVEVTVDGNWRRWHVLPQLGGGDRLACATPNTSFAEFIVDRDTIEGRPVFFNARSGVDQAEQGRRCIELLELARAHHCRIVAFPELSVSMAVRATLSQWLDNQEVVEVVVAGSCHVAAEDEDDERWHNQAAVFLRGFKKPILHHKFRPFSFSDPIDAPREERIRRHEHLAVRTPTLTAHLSPHWTAVVLICKDSIQEPIPRLLGDLRANLVLVPVLSFKMDAFRSVAAAVATRSQGITLMANACVGADDESERPPLVIGMPSQLGSVISETPPPFSLVIATIGSLTGKPSIVTLPDTA